MPRHPLVLVTVSLTSCWIALAPLPLAAGQDATQVTMTTAPAPLQGSWCSPSGSALRFFATRVARFQGGLLGFHLAHFEDALVDLLAWGRVEHLFWELSEDGSTLRVGDERLPDGTLVHEERFTRSAEEPAVLRVPVIEFGTEAADEERVAAVREEIARRMVEDQAVRTGGKMDPERMRAVDTDNTAWMIDQVEEIGWIDGARFGRPAARAAFLIVQHSGDLGLMGAALPAILADFRAGHAEGGDYALLFDRLEVNLGRPQLYGSQLGGIDSEHLLLMPLAKPEEVDALRAEVGLPPLETYLALFEGPAREKPVRRLTLEDWFLPR